MTSLTRRGAADDTATILETLPQAGEHIAEVACATNNEKVGERVRSQGPVETVADKGYHSNDALRALDEAAVRTYISEPDRGRRYWIMSVAGCAATPFVWRVGCRTRSR